MTASDSQTVDPAQIAMALQLIGLEFSDDELAQMAKGLVQWQQQYQELRAVALDNSVPPALTFQPRTIEIEPPAPSAVSEQGEGRAEPALPRPARAAHLAFASVAELGRLLRSGQVRALELAELYLERLRR